MIDTLQVAAAAVARAYEDGSWLDRERMGPKLDLLRDAVLAPQPEKREWLRARLLALTECYPDNVIALLGPDSLLGEHYRYEREDRINALLDLLLGPAPAVPAVDAPALDVEVAASVGPPG